MSQIEEAFQRVYRKEQPASFTSSPTNFSLPQRTRKIALINQKGGCGKTTTAVNLSACLAELGARVLVVDVDPQAHTTLGFGFRGDELPLTLYHALKATDGISMEQVTQPTYHPNLKLVPSNTLLASLQVELVNLYGRERVLRDRLQQVSSPFHFIFLDCPPSLNLLTVNALTAATEVLIPIQTHYLSLDGMRELFKTIELVRERLNPSLHVSGILATLFDSRTRMNRVMLDTIREYFKEKVFNTVIHMSAVLTEYPMMGQPVIRYAPHTRGAKDYRELAQELLNGSHG